MTTEDISYVEHIHSLSFGCPIDRLPLQIQRRLDPSPSLTMSTRWSVVHSDGRHKRPHRLQQRRRSHFAIATIAADAVLTTANNQTEEDHSSCCGHEKIGGALLNGRESRERRACSWIDQGSVWDRREGCGIIGSQTDLKSVEATRAKNVLPWKKRKLV